MEVEPSGVIMAGTCHIQTRYCTAMGLDAVTAVFVNKKQIDVCRACLDEKIRMDEWHIKGVKKLPLQVDIEVTKNESEDLAVDFLALAKDKHGNVLMTESLSVPYGTRLKFGEDFLINDLKLSLKNRVQKLLMENDSN